MNLMINKRSIFIINIYAYINIQLKVLNVKAMMAYRAIAVNIPR